MELEVFNKEDEKEDKKVRLKLEDDGCGEIDLQVVDENGDNITTLLTVQEDGTIKRHGSVDDDLGFELDSKDRVKFDC